MYASFWDIVQPKKLFFTQTALQLCLSNKVNCMHVDCLTSFHTMVHRNWAVRTANQKAIL